MKDFASDPISPSMVKQGEVKLMCFSSHAAKYFLFLFFSAFDTITIINIIIIIIIIFIIM